MSAATPDWGRWGTPEVRPVAALANWEENPREIDEKRYRQLLQSMQQDPQFLTLRPLIGRADGVVFCGNMRLRAARELGWDTIPAVLVDVDEEQAQEWALRDNNNYGDWDEDALTEMLTRYRAAGRDLDSLGFSDDQLHKYLTMEPPTQVAAPDDTIPAVPVTPTCEPGDVWLLGDHRLVIGDCTDPLVLDRAMGKDVADLLFTDPPYGVRYMEDSIPGSEIGKWHRTDGKLVDNDNLTAAQTRQLLVDAFSLADTVLKAGGVYYCCSPSGQPELTFRLAVDDVGWGVRQVIAWVKQRFVFGRQDYQWRHESVLYGWKKGAGHYFVPDHTQDTVWEIDNQRVSVEHPTMKPVELVTRAVRNSSRPGEHVLDNFAGSGTTVVVCESLGRVCHAVEKNTGYGDVIVRRWQEFTNREATLEGTDRTFAEVGKERWDRDTAPASATKEG